jgi:predicted transposase YbfD/YdcC
MIMDETKDGFLDYFEDLPDHRMVNKCKHSVSEILLLTICAFLSGADSWDDIEAYGFQKIDYLRTRLPYKHGIPSDDTIRRFFRALDPSAFQEKFTAWVTMMFGPDLAQQIAIDGKSLRGTRFGNEKALHLVGAYACEKGLLLAQKVTEEKSNEITAIPDLLDWLDLKGTLVSIDAMGCQILIADKICSKGGDYFFALKGNQGNLNDSVRLFFEKPPQSVKIELFEDFNKDHGRIEERRASVFHDVHWLHEIHKNWLHVRTIIKIDSKREMKGKVEKESRYFISSRKLTAKEALQASRAHWGIENGNHHILDVSYNEDASQIAMGNAPENMGIIRRIALNLQKAMKLKYKRRSYKGMRKSAGWDNRFLDEIFDTNFMR